MEEWKSSYASYHIIFGCRVIVYMCCSVPSSLRATDRYRAEYKVHYIPERVYRLYRADVEFIWFRV